MDYSSFDFGVVYDEVTALLSQAFPDILIFLGFTLAVSFAMAIFESLIPINKRL
jgi:hypothetical protein